MPELALGAVFGAACLVWAFDRGAAECGPEVGAT